MSSLDKNDNLPAETEPALRIPEWLRRPTSSRSSSRKLKSLLRSSSLNTVCEEARCPNLNECFSHGTATFMILGDVCTRGCKFCSVHTGKPAMHPSLFHQEAQRVAEAASKLNLKHIVVTSVARDDLDDGGASGFIDTIKELRQKISHATVEILIPDFRRKEHVLSELVAASPDVINHNLETTPRLYRQVRPGASYQGSLQLLKTVKELNPKICTKTGIMVGLGETSSEVIQIMHDCSDIGVDIFTIGQYMRPSRNHLPVKEYIQPKIFDEYTSYAHENKLFQHIFSGPLVRSSYHAGEQYTLQN